MSVELRLKNSASLLSLSVKLYLYLYHRAQSTLPRLGKSYIILQAIILEWVAFPLSRDLPNSGIEAGSPASQADSLPAEPQGTPQNTEAGSLSLVQWIFPTHESNWSLLRCRQILYHLGCQGSPGKS